MYAELYGRDKAGVGQPEVKVTLHRQDGGPVQLIAHEASTAEPRGRLSVRRLTGRVALRGFSPGLYRRRLKIDGEDVARSSEVAFTVSGSPGSPPDPHPHHER